MFRRADARSKVGHIDKAVTKLVCLISCIIYDEFIGHDLVAGCKSHAVFPFGSERSTEYVLNCI